MDYNLISLNDKLIFELIGSILGLALLIGYGFRRRQQNQLKIEQETKAQAEQTAARAALEEQVDSLTQHNTTLI
ncbi:MAG: hypothetical protein F6K19_22520, partial [Cyanothece sp. SIO1E1]|nr:hypothetical protein [Cyanothece sp. SIO1E1]